MTYHSAAIYPTSLALQFQKALLIIANDDDTRKVVDELARSCGWSAAAIPSFRQAEPLLTGNTFDCILIDTGIGGIQVRRLLQCAAKALVIQPILLISNDPQGAGDALAAAGFLLGLNMCHPISKDSPARIAIRLMRIQDRLMEGYTNCCHRDCFWRKRQTVADVPH